MDYDNYRSPTPMSAAPTPPSDGEAKAKDLIILQAAATNLRDNGDVGEIEDHVLRLLQ
ncbi:hypothetical protein NW755_013225 [Fusarium falciforme]|uniref:Uncharacterized protein n=1 Tax=Fusarium falciforme TaxID=195108 RepID=A0A9W8QWA2_9HYPO|nr:hypothetical protein NW755_013225 [Fusarium falciforme]KAJ4246488.1 hypothetical protein NW757_009537 [Fusarium falciforme]